MTRLNEMMKKLNRNRRNTVEFRELKVTIESPRPHRSGATTEQKDPSPENTTCPACRGEGGMKGFGYDLRCEVCQGTGTTSPTEADRFLRESLKWQIHP